MTMTLHANVTNDLVPLMMLRGCRLRLRKKAYASRECNKNREELSGDGANCLVHKFVSFPIQG